MSARESKLGDGMAPETEAAWLAANHAALDLGHSWLGTEHLLLGLLRGPAEDPAARILTDFGVTLDRVRAALVPLREDGRGSDDRRLLASLGIDLDSVRDQLDASFGPEAIDKLYDRRRRGGRRLARGPLCGLTMSPRAKKALARARQTAKAAHRPLLTTTDLLTGVIQTPDAKAARLLSELGADTAAVLARTRPRAAG